LDKKCFLGKVKKYFLAGVGAAGVPHILSPAEMP
jgi:hypothetical protein